MSQKRITLKMLNQIQSKILTLPELITQSKIWKNEMQKIVFTNGCFDLIHSGHLHYLMEARALGQKLVIGLNSDASVQRLKGKNRPVKDQQTRLLLLASMEFVDAVCVFEEDTPLQLINSILPDILVKGGDWPIDQIVGAKEVQAAGGTVKSLQFLTGNSTSSIIEKIKNEE